MVSEPTLLVKRGSPRTPLVASHVEAIHTGLRFEDPLRATAAEEADAEAGRVAKEQARARGRDTLVPRSTERNHTHA